VEIVASLSQGRTAAAQCGLFTYKSVPVIFEPPCILILFNNCRREISNVQNLDRFIGVSQSLSLKHLYKERIRLNSHFSQFLQTCLKNVQNKLHNNQVITTTVKLTNDLKF